MHIASLLGAKMFLIRLAWEVRGTQYSSTRFNQSRLNRFYLSWARDSTRLGSDLGSVELQIVVRLDSGLVSFLTNSQTHPVFVPNSASRRHQGKICALCSTCPLRRSPPGLVVSVRVAGGDFKGNNPPSSFFENIVNNFENTVFNSLFRNTYFPN